MATNEPVELFLGFDPGGEGRPNSRGNFGWSICKEVDGSLKRLDTGLSKNAWDAIDRVKSAINAHYPHGNFHVMAAGIDAPLLWNKRGDRKGYRKADDVLIKVLKETGGPWNSVVAPNGLYGAVGMQGPLLARHLSGEWALMITESHPTAFRYLLSHVEQPEMVKTAVHFRRRY